MKGYWINRCHVTNAEEYGQYAKLAGPAIEKYGGKFLVRGGDQVELEGSGLERIVLVEFDSKEKALEAYHSEEYKVALEHALVFLNAGCVIVPAEHGTQSTK